MSAAPFLLLATMPMVRAASLGYYNKFVRDGDGDGDDDDDDDHDGHHDSSTSSSSTSPATSSMSTSTSSLITTATSSTSSTSSSSSTTTSTSSLTSSTTTSASTTGSTSQSLALSSSSTSSTTSSATGLAQGSPTAQVTSQSGLGGGAVGGIVVAAIVLFAILFNLFLFVRRRIRNKRLELESANLAAFEDKNGPSHPSTALLAEHPASLRPASVSAADSFNSTPTAPLLGAFYDSEGPSGQAPRGSRTDNLAVPGNSLSRTTSEVTLPNPYEGYDVISTYAATSGSPPTSQSASSPPPSSFRPVSTQSADTGGVLAYLDRGSSRHTTSSNHTSAGVSLQEEMTTYQKRLEAQGSSVPADPPPGYRESVSGPSSG